MNHLALMIGVTVLILGVRAPCSVDADCDDDDSCTMDLCQSGTCVHEDVDNVSICTARRQMVPTLIAFGVTVVLTAGFVAWTLWKPSRFGSKTPSLTENKMKW